jgi:hypothetical protein
MHDPSERSERNKPENPGENEKEDRGKQTSLKQLTQTWNEETGGGGQHVARGSLSCVAHAPPLAEAAPDVEIVLMV